MRTIHFLSSAVKMERPWLSLAVFLVISFALAGSGHAQKKKDPIRCPDIAAPHSEPVKTGGNLKLLKGEEPEYPEEARRQRIVGAVLLQVIVNEEGQVFEVEPLRGYPLLILAALEAVCGWQFEPVMLKGKAVPVVRTIALRFDSGVDPPAKRHAEGIPEFVVNY